jgi:Domain of unknown function (DUF4328)
MLSPNAYMESNAGLSRWLRISLIALVVCIFGGMLFSILTDFIYSNAHEYTRGIKLLAWFFSQALNGLDFLLSAVVAALFLMWLHRSAYNLAVGGRDMTYTPGRIIGVWFIPFVNLFAPLPIFQELVTHYADIAQQEQVGQGLADAEALHRRLRAWFVLFWVGTILGMIAAVRFNGNFQEASLFSVISDTVRAVPIFLFLPILKALQPLEAVAFNAWQRDDAARREARRKPYIQQPMPNVEGGRAEWYREEADAKRFMGDTDPFAD